MFSLEIQDELLRFKDIKLEHLPLILSWYNMVDDFKFATGVDRPITLDVMTQKYAEVAICSNEFFAAIFLKSECKMIGIVKGSIKYENKDSVWIRSIVIDRNYQSKGYGSKSVDLLLNNLSESFDIKNAYLAVVEENFRGRRFWIKQRFQELRRIENHYKLKNEKQNVIIMGRQISDGNS